MRETHEETLENIIIRMTLATEYKELHELHKIAIDRVNIVYHDKAQIDDKIIELNCIKRQSELRIANRHNRERVRAAYRLIS